MNILFVAPLPPPITGHSNASQVLLKYLKRRYSVEVINLSSDSSHDGSITLKRILRVFVIIYKSMRAARYSDRMYLTISESVAGNFKDMLLYIVIGKLLKNTVIHLHGGSFSKQIIERSLPLRILNKHFLSRIHSAIISGPSHALIFGNLISSSRIYLVPNFAQKLMFLNRKQVKEKFNISDDNLRILYVSSMNMAKGYSRLLDAYEALSERVQLSIRIDFAGKFDNQTEYNRFINRISKLPRVEYHGVISDKKKSTLFAKAHIFCLPTNFHEGQPMSIIEAYASGCVVVTTARPGILDIFKPLKNGFLIDSNNPISLKNIIEFNCKDLPKIGGIALNNRDYAEKKFREQTFCKSIESILSIDNK